MASAIVSALANTMMGNLNNLAHEEIGLYAGVKTEMEKLGSTLSTIHAVLHDAEQKQWKSEAVKIWLRKLKDVAYDAEDVLDEFAIEAQRRRLPREFKNRVRSFFSLENPLVFPVTMAHKLKNIREKLEAVARDRQFHLTEGVKELEADNLDWRLTSSIVNESQIYGRENEKAQLINNLLADASDLSVHAICGMGGLGKTTLARLVYNDGRIRNKFELRIWVCVSDDFDARRLTRALIESVEDSPCNIQELDPLQRHLQKKLNGRKFLLVLDDVWNENNEKWENLKDSLRCGAKGSAIVTTTRIENIAIMMATTPIHRMGRLSDDDSWSLFELRAFDLGRRSKEYAHLEVIGREIVKKCGGIPLAIKAMGSLMRFKRRDSEWLFIKKSDIWDLAGTNILPALKLSYEHLSPHLKQCFAFCCIFPKDYVMEKDMLIQLWMANGFISCQKQMDLHDMGEEIFNELVWRSFFQDINEDIYGNTTCKMHDFVHDLAKSIMVEECCLIEHGVKFEAFRKARHIALSYATINGKELLQSMRSFLILSNVYFESIPNFSIFKHSRAVKIRSGFSLTSIGNLKYLRYLDVFDSSIKILPKSISCLYNLQTLNLRNCRSLQRLPKHMNGMKNLTYLEISGCYELRCMTKGMGQLTYLRKLSMFIVGKEEGCQVEELRGLKLGGELTIKNLDNVKSFIDARSANLITKKDLRSLSLCWGENNNLNVEGVLNGFEPCSNLKRLEIDGYQGSNFAEWMMRLSLPNLVEIMLKDCSRCEHLPSFGRLQFLKKFSLKRMDAVKYIDNDMDAKHDEISFPSLEELSLDSMASFEKWAKSTRGKNIFPRLTQVEVNGCPKCSELPHLPSVEKLKIGSINKMLLSSVANFNTLNYFEIRRIDNLMVFPHGMMQNLTALERLEIKGIDSLKSLSGQLDNLSALKFLGLYNCSRLESLWDDGLCNLKSLETLEIEYCGIVSFPNNGLCDLSSLCQLTIDHCFRFASLSEELRCMSALKKLMIRDCQSLKKLPDQIGHLTSLSSIKIVGCSNLMSLPDGMENLVSLSSILISYCPNLMSLPDGMKNLKALTDLSILYSPHLKRRCKKNKGADWPKIAHIPFVHLM